MPPRARKPRKPQSFFAGSMHRPISGSAARHIEDQPSASRLRPRCRYDENGVPCTRGARLPMTILFLDFDGVLHPDPCPDRQRLFEHAPALAQALAPFTTLQIVLSTAWRTDMPLVDLACHLPRPLRSRLVGTTRRFSEISCAPALVPYRRQAECQHWLDHERPGAPWIALDDRASGFEPYCDRLILTRSDTGLDASTLNRLRFALMRALQPA